MRRACSFCLLVLAALASAASFEPAALRSRVQALASPEMEGRAALSAGARKARDYAIAEFRRLGLQPGGRAGSFEHRFTVRVGYRAAQGTSLSLGERPLRLDDDFRPMLGSVTGETREGPLVLVSPELFLDARNFPSMPGAILVVPRPGAPNVPVQTVTSVAHQAEAAGVIFVGPLQQGSRPVPNYSFPEVARGNVVVMGASWQSFTQKVPIPRLEPGAIVELGESARMFAAVEPDEGEDSNVIAMLPGTDERLRDEVIVVGAHYDHVGWGEFGSRTGRAFLHLGADDNASGTAGVLELARALKATGGLRRTVLFQLYGAEEVGLVGSAAWVRDNHESVGKVVAMVNLDMIGRLRENRLTVFGVGSADPLPELVSAANRASLELNLVKGSPSNSDHQSFIDARVPSLLFFTGLTPEYHTEFDTVDTLNFEGMAKILEVVLGTIRGIDALDSRPTFRAPGGGSMGSAPRVPR